MLLLGAIAAPVFLFFLLHSAGQKIQPNWPGFIYPVAILAGVHGVLAYSKEHALPRWAVAGFGLAPWIGAAFTAVAFFQLGLGLLPIDGKKDPTARLKGWAQLGAEVAGIAERQGAAAILTANYASTGELAFYGSGGCAGASGGRAHPLRKPTRSRRSRAEAGARAADRAQRRGCLAHGRLFRQRAAANHC